MLWAALLEFITAHGVGNFRRFSSQAAAGLMVGTALLNPGDIPGAMPCPLYGGRFAVKLVLGRRAHPVVIGLGGRFHFSAACHSRGIKKWRSACSSARCCISTCSVGPPTAYSKPRFLTSRLTLIVAVVRRWGDH